LNRKLYQRRLNGNEDIQKIIKELSKFNTNTSVLTNFKQYLVYRRTVEDKLYTFYSDLVFKTRKFSTYQKTQKSETELIKNIKEKFGPSEFILAYGNWNNPNQYKGVSPSPTCGMRKLLQHHFKCITVPEAYTTKTCSICLTQTLIPGEKRPVKNAMKLIAPRGLRHCQNDKCKVWWNRDYNAAMNIKQNLLYFIQNGLWSPSFSQKNDSNGAFSAERQLSTLNECT